MKSVRKGSVASFLLTVLLNVSSGLVLLGLALSVLVLVLAPFVPGPLEVDASSLVVGSRMTVPVSFRVDAATHPIRSSSLGVEDAQIQDARGRLRFPAPRGAFFFLNMLLVIVAFALTAWVLGQLRAVFRTVRDGRPFVEANATRIRRIALVILASFGGGDHVRREPYVVRHFSVDGSS
jgi:hypothetical protein